MATVYAQFATQVNNGAQVMVLIHINDTPPGIPVEKTLRRTRRPG